MPGFESTGYNGFELGLQGTRFRRYGAPDFESMGYMVSRVSGYRIRGV